MDDSDNFEQVIYPVQRLLANPRVFYAIAELFDGPDGETVQEAFYDAIEYKLPDAEDPSEFIFDCQEVCFRFYPESGDFHITLDNGVCSMLEVLEGELQAKINNDSEWAASTAIYQCIVDALEKADPNLSGNIALCSPPTPGNGYLRSPDGEQFVGSFHLLTDPEKLYAFHIDIVDVETNKLQAFIRPL